MAKVTIQEVFRVAPEQLWEIVTNNIHFSWRSDLERIEIIDDTKFVEYTKEGIATEFTITCKEEGSRYEFDMNNKNMQGHWTGIFRKVEGGVEVEFTEEVNARNPIMNVFAGIYLRKQQKQYIVDLKKEMEKE